MEDDDALKQVPKFKYLGSIFTADGENKEDIWQRIKEDKVMYNNERKLLCSNNLSLEMKKKLIKSCIWSVAFYGSETWTLGKKCRKGSKCTWNMKLEKNVTNKMDR